jgi:CDP-2,3-bis-(O-geranylgeranyl)-sn-glycerol synthase
MIATMFTDLHALLQMLWLFLPAIVANSIPVVAAHYGWLPQLDQPLDGGIKWRNRALFGEHKTIRGFVVGISAAALTGAVQAIFFRYQWAHAVSLLPYQSMIFTAFFGAWLGTSALATDAIKSLIKRQFDIRPGKSWPPFDQIDFVIGVLLAASFFIRFTFAQIILTLIFFGAGSFLVSVAGVMSGIKKSL